MGNNIEGEPSNMVLRRIPKHMSFLDSFFKVSPVHSSMEGGRVRVKCKTRDWKPLLTKDSTSLLDVPSVCDCIKQLVRGQEGKRNAPGTGIGSEALVQPFQ